MKSQKFFNWSKKWFIGVKSQLKLEANLLKLMKDCYKKNLGFGGIDAILPNASDIGDIVETEAE